MGKDTHVKVGCNRLDRSLLLGKERRAALGHALGPLGARVTNPVAPCRLFVSEDQFPFRIVLGAQPSYSSVYVQKPLYRPIVPE